MARYDEYAGWYDDWIAAPADDLVALSLFRVMGPVTSTAQRVLDLACGQGRVARALAADGNDVVGVDLSGELLAFARAADCRRITYIQTDVCSTDWWDGVPFDGVVASMALMDIDALEGAVRTAATVLRPGGWFAWSIIHPLFPGIAQVRASWPTGGSYFDKGWWQTDGDGLRGRVGSSHRTLSTYLNVMVEHGFVLEAAEEPPWQLSPSDPPMPFFLVTRWRRC